MVKIKPKLNHIHEITFPIVPVTSLKPSPLAAAIFIAGLRPTQGFLAIVPKANEPVHGDQKYMAFLIARTIVAFGFSKYQLTTHFCSC
jgi:hypothetical protein